jgi:Condensation domain
MMMKLSNNVVEDLLREANLHGLELVVEHGQLRYTACPANVPDELMKKIEEHRAALIFAWPWSTAERARLHAGPVFSRRSNAQGEVRLLVHASTPREAFSAELAHVHFMNSTHMTLRYHAPFYAHALAAAAEQVTLRYPVLASVFSNGEAGPSITVGVGKRPVVEEYDVSSEAPATRERHAREIASRVICRPFEPEVGPLFRLFCIKLGECDFVIGYVIHHLVCDHTASMTVKRELMMMYQACLQGLPIPQRRPSMEYTDYLQATWDWLNTEVGDAAKRYWQARLRGAPATRLASLEKHDEFYDEDARLREFHIDRQVLQRLRKFGTDHKIRMSTMCLTAKILATSSISSSKDVTVAVIMTARQLPQLVGVVGWLGNVLPIRVTLEADDSFEDVARKVELRLEEARRYIFYPYSFLQAIMQEVPSSFIFPFYNYKETSVIAASAESAKLAEDFPIDFVNGTFINGSHFFEAMVSDSGITGSLQYSPRLYSPDIVSAFLDMFTSILESVPNRASRSVLPAAAANF